MGLNTLRGPQLTSRSFYVTGFCRGTGLSFSPPPLTDLETKNFTAGLFGMGKEVLCLYIFEMFRRIGKTSQESLNNFKLQAFVNRREFTNNFVSKVTSVVQWCNGCSMYK